MIMYDEFFMMMKKTIKRALWTLHNHCREINCFVDSWLPKSLFKSFKIEKNFKNKNKIKYKLYNGANDDVRVVKNSRM